MDRRDAFRLSCGSSRRETIESVERCESISPREGRVAGVMDERRPRVEQDDQRDSRQGEDMSRDQLSIRTRYGDSPAHIFKPAGSGPWPAAIF
jgi:hypothetical protein